MYLRINAALGYALSPPFFRLPSTVLFLYTVFFARIIVIVLFKLSYVLRTVHICWVAYIPPYHGVGTEWTWPSFVNNVVRIHNDNKKKKNECKIKKQRTRKGKNSTKLCKTPWQFTTKIFKIFYLAYNSMCKGLQNIVGTSKRCLIFSECLNGNRRIVRILTQTARCSRVMLNFTVGMSIICV